MTLGSFSTIALYNFLYINTVDVQSKNMMMKQPTLGQKITKLRQEKGLTQEELVALCNISVRTIQRIESGETTPRMYTIKTILDALGYDLDTLKEEVSQAKSEFKEMVLPKIAFENAKTKVNLRWGWIAGVLFFLISTLDIIYESFRITTGESILNIYLIVIVKALLILTYFMLMRGLMTVGTLFKNYLLKISAMLTFVFAAFFYAFDILDLLVLGVDVEIMFMVKSMTLGLVGIFLGIGLCSLKSPLKTVGLVAGVLEIVAGACFLLVLLSFGGVVFWSGAIIAEIVLLYRVTAILESEQV